MTKGSVDDAILGSYRFFPFLFALLFGAWVNADAATDFCALVDLGLLRIFDAFDATFFDVRSFRLAMTHSFKQGHRYPQRKWNVNHRWPAGPGNVPGPTALYSRPVRKSRITPKWPPIPTFRTHTG